MARNVAYAQEKGKPQPPSARYPTTGTPWPKNVPLITSGQKVEYTRDAPGGARVVEVTVTPEERTRSAEIGRALREGRTEDVAYLASQVPKTPQRVVGRFEAGQDPLSQFGYPSGGLGDVIQVVPTSSKPPLTQHPPSVGFKDTVKTTTIPIYSSTEKDMDTPQSSGYMGTITSPINLTIPKQGTQPTPDIISSYSFPTKDTPYYKKVIHDVDVAFGGALPWGPSVRDLSKKQYEDKLDRWVKTKEPMPDDLTPFQPEGTIGKTFIADTQGEKSRFLVSDIPTAGPAREYIKSPPNYEKILKQNLFAPTRQTLITTAGGLGAGVLYKQVAKKVGPIAAQKIGVTTMGSLFTGETVYTSIAKDMSLGEALVGTGVKYAVDPRTYIFAGATMGASKFTKAEQAKLPFMSFKKPPEYKIVSILDTKTGMTQIKGQAPLEMKAYETPLIEKWLYGKPKVKEVLEFVGAGGKSDKKGITLLGDTKTPAVFDITKTQTRTYDLSLTKFGKFRSKLTGKDSLIKVSKKRRTETTLSEQVLGESEYAPPTWKKFTSMYEGEVLPEFKMGKVGEPKGHTEVLNKITFGDVTLKYGAGRTSLNKEFGFKQLEFKSDLGDYKVISKTKKGLTTIPKFDKLERPTIEWYPTKQGPGGGILTSTGKDITAIWQTPLISKNWFKPPKKKLKGLTGKNIKEIYKPSTATELQRFPKTETSQKTQLQNTDLSQKLVGGEVIIPSLQQTPSSLLLAVPVKSIETKKDLLFSTQKIEAGSRIGLQSASKQLLQTEKGLTKGLKFGEPITQRGIDLILGEPTPTTQSKSTPFSPSIVSPPIVPPSGGRGLIGVGFLPAGRLGGRRKRIRRRKQPKKYASTLVARTFRIRGKQPKLITGLEIRPIVKKSKKKKKRKKSRKRKVRF